MRISKIFVFLLVSLVSICLIAQQQPSKPQQQQTQQQQPPDPEAWPRVFQGGEYTLTIYQPELDSWDGFHISAHYALSLQKGKDGNATYGVAWVTADSEIDKEDRMVTLDDIQVTKVHFPSAPEQEPQYLAMIKERLPKTKEVSLDRLEEAAEVIHEEQKANLPLKNDPPRIIFSSVPAILIYIDGNPDYKPVTGTSLQRVINTRSLLVKDGSGKLFVHVFDGWLESASFKVHGM